MVQPPSNVYAPSLRLPHALPADPLAKPANRQPGRKVRARTRALREVVVVDVGVRLGDAAEDLDRAIQLALADGPRGVVCDLSNVLGGAHPEVVEVLAAAGRHVRDWPGIPVAVACPDPQVREALRAHPLGGHLIVTASLFSAVSAVLVAPALAVARLRLTSHPTAPRASRDFVARTLLDWRLGRVIPFASVVVGELVAMVPVHAGTNIDLSAVWNLGALRLAVRDHSPTLRRQSVSAFDLHEPELAAVSRLTRAFGVLPAADGGRLLWAVLEAPRPRTPSRRTGRDHTRADQERFTD